jgi:hypothetical protein
MVVVEHPAKALAPLNGVMGQGGGGYGLQESVFDSLVITFDMVVRHELPDCVLKGRVHGELLIKRRPVCGKGHDSVLARRTAVAGRFGAQHGLAVRPEFSP